MTEIFSETRKRDRTKMVFELSKLVLDNGGTVLVEPEGMDNLHQCKALLRVIAPGGAFTGITFNGKSIQPNVFVFCWNLTRSPSWTNENENHAFNPKIWGSDLDPYHHRKIQRVCDGFSALCNQVKSDLEVFASGKAYDED